METKTNIKETAVVITGVREKYESSVKREETYDKTFFIQNLALKAVEKMETDGEQIPADCPFADFEECREEIKGNIKSAKSSQDRIDKEKKHIEAMTMFLDVIVPEHEKGENV